MKVLLISLVLSLGLIVPFAKSVKPTNRIFGGVNVEIEDFPHQVSVRTYDQHLCGGSIIDPYTILTAANCFDGIDYSELSIRYGSTYQSQGSFMGVSRIIRYPYFNPGTLDNDIAILKLSRALRFDSNAQAILLNNMEIAAGTTAWVIGWDALKEGVGEIPVHLQAVNVQIITNTQCNSNYTGRINAGMICAQKNGHGVCKGDSGGSLISGGKLIGVISWGNSCEQPQYPHVYTNVYHYVDWIIKNAF